MGDNKVPSQDREAEQVILQNENKFDLHQANCIYSMHLNAAQMKRAQIWGERRKNVQFACDWQEKITVEYSDLTYLIVAI